MHSESQNTYNKKLGIKLLKIQNVTLRKKIYVLNSSPVLSNATQTQKNQHIFLFNPLIAI